MYYIRCVGRFFCTILNRSDPGVSGSSYLTVRFKHDFSKVVFPRPYNDAAAVSPETNFPETFGDYNGNLKRLLAIFLAYFFFLFTLKFVTFLKRAMKIVRIVTAALQQ